MNAVFTSRQSPVASSYSVVIAGSTERTKVCARSLFADSRFQITGIITPSPKPIGREQILTKNPMHLWAEENRIPIILLEKKIDESVRQTITYNPASPACGLQPTSLLFVVDFGYMIPKWLLDWPTIAAVNVHPSLLPKYRGSSPGQFALLFGEKESAVTFMEMDDKMDHGPIIAQLPFPVDPTWKTPDYYKFAFDLTHDHLTETLADFCEKKVTPIPQPDDSPTPTAKHLKRENGFVPLETLKALLTHSQLSTLNSQLPAVPFLSHYSLATSRQSLYNLWRAFYPWPGLWTEIFIGGEKKRVKLLELHMNGDKLFLDQIHIEGKNPQTDTTLLFET